MQRGVQRSVKSLWSPPFTISALILATCAVGLGPMTRYMRVVLAKEAIPLRSPLSRLDKSGLGPYGFVQAITLDSALVNTLGTPEYIHWILEDSALHGQSSPLRYVNLFVTYYTGQPDPVPHVPDACYVGSGYITESAENTTVQVSTLGASGEVPVRMLTFVKSGIFGDDKMPVVYMFHCNGRFVATRQGVRSAVNNPLDRHAYYSKVEVRFGWDGASPRVPTKAQAIAGTERLFSYLLPLLVEEHWPEWNGE
ncbi:MAG: exosortase-associated EpsI family protein [Phycisphaerae bacterium]